MPAPFIDGFGPAIGISAALSVLGAAAGLALPGRGRVGRVAAVPALDAQV